MRGSPPAVGLGSHAGHGGGVVEHQFEFFVQACLESAGDRVMERPGRQHAVQALDSVKVEAHLDAGCPRVRIDQDEVSAVGPQDAGMSSMAASTVVRSSDPPP